MIKKLNHRPKKFSKSLFELDVFRLLGPKIWELVPDNVKHAKSLGASENALKNCIHGVGYIN